MQNSTGAGHAKPAPPSLPVLPSLMRHRIGIIPLPIYVVLLVLFVGFSLTKKINGEISMMVAALALGGFTCAEIGNRIPILRTVGGAALVTIFLPSFLVDAHLLPAQFIEAVTTFTISTNFIYLFISAVVVGSILSMDRNAMIQGFIKIFVPLMAGSAVSMIVGVAVASLVGLGAWRSLFFVVVPIMAGGIGEGAIPLSLGYSEILGQKQGPLLAQLLPIVFFGNLTAILISGLLRNLGKRYPHLTGNGRLQPGVEAHNPETAGENPAAHSDVTADVGAIAAGGILAITAYLVGVMLNSFTRLPAPVGMLLIAVLVKLMSAVPPILEEGTRVVFRFFVTAVTYPLLFATAVAQTPWHELVAAFHPANLITIVATVASLTASGYFVGGWLGMYPVEAAIVNATHSGLGGTGDVMILSAAERLELMPFAQVATRIGGAITVTLALIALSRLGAL
jgi:malate:Na+ symporter